MTFSEQLKELISSKSISKNSIIKETGIDRSTFFQILNGKRFPTESVFSEIMRFFIRENKEGSPEIKQDDLDLLLNAYLENVLNSSQMESWHTAETFIRRTNRALCWTEKDTSASEKDNSSAKAKVHQFLQRQLDTPQGKLDLYLSPDLIDQFDIYDFMMKTTHSRPEIRQLIGVYQNQPMKTTSMILDCLAECIGYMNKHPQNYMVYCSRDSIIGKQNIPYPYYLIGSDEALLLTYDGSEAVCINNKEYLDALHERFEKIISETEPLFNHVSNYTQLAQNLMISYKDGSNQLIYSVAERPCFFEIVTPEIISKHAPSKELETFAINYISLLQSLPNFYALNSIHGAESFSKDKLVSEAGVNIQIDDDDLIVLKSRFDKALWDQIVLLPYSSCFIHNWEIAIYYPNAVFLSPYDSTDSVLWIKDKALIDMLFAYYDSMFRTLHK